MMEQDADGLVAKLEALRCNKSDCRPIAHEVHEETLDKAISIVRQHQSKEREALRVAREVLEGIKNGSEQGICWCDMPAKTALKEIDAVLGEK